MKTAGLLGALEVSMFEKYMRAKSGANVFAHDLEPDRDGADEETLSKVPDEESLGRLDRYYLAVVVKALMKVLREPTQTMHHQTAINITTRIIRNLGRRSHYQADEVIDAIFDRLEASAPGVGSMHNSLIDLLITLISSAGSHLSKHYPDIIKFVCDNFAQHQQSSLLIIEALHNGISAQDFVYVIREIIPVLVSTIEHEPLQSAENGDFSSRSLMSSGPHLSGRLEEETRKSLPRSGQIIRTLLRIADGLEDYKGVLIPVLLGIVSDTSVISQRRTEALRALMYLVRDVELNQLVGRIVHPLVRLLDSSQLDLVEAALTSLSTLACRLGKSYEPFIVPVRRKMRVLSAKDATMRLPQLEEYETIIALIMKGRPLPPLPESAASILPELDEKKFSMTPMKHLNESLPISMPMLETAWTLQTSRSGTSDFVEWYRRLTFEFIRQSPTSIIRQCTGLAKNYRPLAQDLLNASFISLWDSVASEAIATNVVVNVPLIEAFEKALKDSNIPNNITNAILNLAEFMDLQDKMLPFDIPLLAQNAGSRSGMLAKCVRYSEMEFRALNVPPTPECVESLITVYHQLGYQDSAVGLITCVKERHSERIPMKADWLEKLNRYDDARAQYESENKNWETIFNDDSPPLGDLWLRRELGILRCLNHLGNFEELEHNALRLRRYIRDVEQVEEKAMWLSGLKQEDKVGWISQIQHLGANASWMLGHWNEMEEVGQRKI
jgi:FKBP12-rapamycin complex-associated protein